MSTIRRLSDTDVRAIFEAVHNNSAPPPHLDFQIVPVGPDGLKLSPPSIEFADGLYILLKPQKRKKSIHDASQPKVPSNLVDKVLKEAPKDECPWSLSGPQFPQPTAIQQRYCYPKGNPEYSSQKGGALWTMYGSDGREDLEYRLLHVYFSAKRAVNKGARGGSTSPYAKRQKLSPKPRRDFRPLSRDRMADDRAHTKTPPPLIPSAQASDPNVSPVMNLDEEPLDFHNFVTPDPNELARFCADQILAPSSPLKAENMDELTFQEMQSCWSDPIFPLGEDHVRLFTNKLDHIARSIQEVIQSSPEHQGHLCSVVSEWAHQLATSPLSEVNLEKIP